MGGGLHAAQPQPQPTNPEPRDIAKNVRHGSCMPVRRAEELHVGPPLLQGAPGLCTAIPAYWPETSRESRDWPDT